MVRLFYSAALLLCIVLPVAADEPPAFPPIGDRYDNIPEDAKAVVKALKKLQARTEIGVNFMDYDRAVSEVYPEVKVFIESAEAREMPELRLVLTNAMGCYLKVRDLWSTKLTTDDVINKFNVSNQLITAQPVLWQVAATNLSGAVALLDSPKEDLLKVQTTLSEGKTKLTVEAAVKMADDQFTILGRRSRAKESGYPLPPFDPELSELSLAELLFQTSDYGEAISAGELSERMPPIYSKVAPANVEGEVPLIEAGKRRGGIAGFLYADVDVAKKAFDVIRGGFGDGRKRAKGLGDSAEGISFSGSTDVLFRRGAAVVHARVPVDSFEKAVSIAKEIDNRLAKHFSQRGGAAEPEEAPAGDSVVDADRKPIGEKGADDETTELIDILFQDGDLGAKITSLGYSDSVPAMFSGLPLGEKSGTISYAYVGERRGGVTGLVYGTRDEAKQAYEKIAAGIGRTAKVTRLGNEACAGSIESKTGDLVFRRDATVIHLRAWADSIEDIAKGARKIDLRIRSAEAKPQTVEAPADRIAVMSPDHIDVTAFVRSASEMLDDGGDAARYAKTLISLSKTTEWERRDEEAKPIRGTLTTITDKGAVIETKSGPVTVSAKELSAESGSKVSRVREMCKRILNLEADNSK